MDSERVEPKDNGYYINEIITFFQEVRDKYIWDMPEEILHTGNYAFRVSTGQGLIARLANFCDYGSPTQEQRLFIENSIQELETCYSDADRRTSEQMDKVKNVITQTLEFLENNK